MKILAIDTSTKYLSLGIYDNAKVYECNLEAGPKLSSLLTVVIKRAIDASGLVIGDFDYFACGLGPGSFTGLRVGLGAVKGLSWARHKPIIGISTLDIMALNAGEGAKFICPVIDAKRNLIYSCFYKLTSGRLKKLTPYMLISKEELCRKLKPQSVLFGDALSLYKEDILKEKPGLILEDKDRWYPKAHNIIKIALQRIKDRTLDDPTRVNPIYLYPKDCQVKKCP